MLVYGLNVLCVSLRV